MSQPPLEQKQFEELVSVASRLTALLERENECLAKFDVRGITGLNEEKQALTQVYCLRVHELKKDPDALRAVTATIRDEVKKVLVRFDEVVKLNERALKATREANDRVLAAIVDAANKQAPQQVSGYSRSGGVAKTYGSAGRIPVAAPVSINRCL
jgi:uncharacterized protein YdhG (YjbR/CyaY superfamily)